MCSFKLFAGFDAFGKTAWNRLFVREFCRRSPHSQNRLNCTSGCPSSTAVDDGDADVQFSLLRGVQFGSRTSVSRYIFFVKRHVALQASVADPASVSHLRLTCLMCLCSGVAWGPSHDQPSTANQLNVVIVNHQFARSPSWTARYR